MTISNIDNVLIKIFLLMMMMICWGVNMDTETDQIFHTNDSSSESELDEDAVAAYYAVRIDKSQGMTITAAAAEGRYDDSSSHAVFLKIQSPVFLQAD